MNQEEQRVVDRIAHEDEQNRLASRENVTWAFRIATSTILAGITAWSVWATTTIYELRTSAMVVKLQVEQYQAISFKLDSVKEQVEGLKLEMARHIASTVKPAP